MTNEITRMVLYSSGVKEDGAREILIIVNHPTGRVLLW